MDMVGLGAEIMIFFVPFLFSLSFHEFAHGWTARRFGDRTAEMAGRLSLSPLAHADPIGTFLLPLAAVIYNTPFFGWANPVPVDERNLKHPRKDMFWIAAAGPISNLLLAFVGVVLMLIALSLFKDDSTLKAIIRFFQTFIMINLSLAFFNMIPIHPLDGGKVIARFLPESINRKMEENQQVLSIILLVLFLSGAMKFLSAPVNWTYQSLVSLVWTAGRFFNLWVE